MSTCIASYEAGGEMNASPDYIREWLYQAPSGRLQLLRFGGVATELREHLRTDTDPETGEKFPFYVDGVHNEWVTREQALAWLKSRNMEVPKCLE